MSYVNTLRNNLKLGNEAKDVSRKAGEGVFANYVRATCYNTTVRNVEQLEAQHKQLVSDLNEISELTKEEKNSLRSAKSVVGKAITNNIDVWQRNEDGTVVHDDNGNPMPKGKSELSESKTDFQHMMAYIDAARKKFESENRDAFTFEEQKQLADAYASLAHDLIEQISNEE